MAKVNLTSFSTEYACNIFHWTFDKLQQRFYIFPIHEISATERLQNQGFMQRKQYLLCFIV